MAMMLLRLCKGYPWRRVVVLVPENQVVLALVLALVLVLVLALLLQMLSNV
jgi:hypothetical protein